jgi:hypothetical protein
MTRCLYRNSVPLWPKTACQLRQWREKLPPEPSTLVFTNRFGQRLSRFGIEKRPQAAAQQAAKVCPSLRGGQVFPHVSRHTTAMHLLQPGVDITAIALWLGHESILTTHKYIQADLEMKKETLSHLQTQGPAAGLFGEPIIMCSWTGRKAHSQGALLIPTPHNPHLHVRTVFVHVPSLPSP